MLGLGLNDVLIAVPVQRHGQDHYNKLRSIALMGQFQVPIDLTAMRAGVIKHFHNHEGGPRLAQIGVGTGVPWCADAGNRRTVGTGKCR